MKLFAKRFRQVFHNSIRCVQTTKLKKNAFLDNSRFQYFFRTLSDKLMWFFAKWFSEGLSKVHSTRPAEIFEEQILWPTKITWIVWDFKRKGFGRWSKLPSTVSCNVNFSRKKCVFWERFIFFDIFVLWVKRFRQSCQNYVIRL